MKEQAEMLQLFLTGSLVLMKGFEILICVQEWEVMLNAEGGNDHIDRLVDGDTFAAQQAIVVGTFNGQLFAKKIR